MIHKAIWSMPVVIAGIAWGASAASCGPQDNNTAEEVSDSTTMVASDTASVSDTATAVVDSAASKQDSLRVLAADSLSRYKTLTDSDFEVVADELGVEIAALKAVVAVEAGTKMEGFWAPGVPIVNFDPSMYRIYSSKAPSKAPDPSAKVPSGLYGYALKEWTQLTNARHKNAQGADMGTFWGMFQIGGFNYKICECATVKEFVDKMSYSELEQLELFAKFIKNSGMLKHLQNKDWAKFARAYNGASYAKRGYHTKMANAYRKFSK